MLQKRRSHTLPVRSKKIVVWRRHAGRCAAARMNRGVSKGGGTECFRGTGEEGWEVGERESASGGEKPV
jgi:hypothetical protein